MTSKPLKSRSGGRSARRASRDKSREIQAPYIQRNVPIYNILSDEGLEQLEFNADSILQEIGLDFHDEPAKQTLREAGADLDGDRVRFPRGMCRKLIQENAPKQFIQHARNPDRSVHIGGSNLVLAPAYGPPFIYNED